MSELINLDQCKAMPIRVKVRVIKAFSDQPAFFCKLHQWSLIWCGSLPFLYNYVKILDVAKCNLGKVNLKAMLSSWMQKACPAAPVTFRTIRDAYTQWLLYAGAQSFGAPKLFAGTPCDPYTQPRVHTSYIRSCFAGAQSLGWPKL